MDRRYRGEVWDGEWTWLPPQARSTSGDREKLSYLLTRMRIQRVGAHGAQAEPEPRAEAPAREAASSEPVRIKVAAYEVTGGAKAVDHIDLRTLAGKNTLPEITEALPAARSVAQWVESEAKLQWPEPTEVKTEESEDRSLSFVLRGRWLDATAQHARLEMDIRQSRSKPGKLLGGRTETKQYRDDRAHRVLALEGGRPIWLSSRDLGWQEPIAENEESTRLLVRLEAVPPKPAGDRPSETRAAPQATRLAVELLALECPMAALSRLDFADLAGRAQTGEQVLAELRKLGKVELRRWLETTLDDLDEELSMTSGQRLPTVQDLTISRSGQITPSISYKEAGTILDLRGRWLSGDRAKQAMLNISLEDSGIVDSPVALPAGTRLPCFTQAKHEQAVRVASGRPLILAGSGAEPAGDGARLGLAVITATRLGGADDPAVDRRDRAEAHLARATAAQQARVRLDVFEVPMTKKALAALDASRFNKASPAEWPGLLEQLGPAKLRYCIDRPVVLTEPVRLVQGASMPTVMSVVTGPRGRAPMPSVTYEEIGYILELAGRWREDSPDIADLALELECSGIEPTFIQPAEGIRLPAFTQCKLSQRTTARSGEPVILLATEMPIPGDDETLPRLLVCRLAVSRDDG